MLNVNNTTKIRKVDTLYYSHYFWTVIYIFRLIKILIWERNRTKMIIVINNNANG